jgi:Tfp pilus assembly protein PilV
MLIKKRIKFLSFFHSLGTKALRHLGTKRGVTLIEAVLAIAIIGAGLIGVMMVFSGGTKSALVSDQSIIASNLAREKMEQIVADRVNKGYATTIATNYSDGALGGNYSAYTRNVTITEVDPNQTTANDDFLVALPGSGYARVTVVVGWGASESVKLETLLANYTMP